MMYDVWWVFVNKKRVPFGLFLLHIVVSVQRLTRLIEFAFEFLNRALDVLTFFNRNDNHCIHLLSMYPGPGSNRHGFPLVFETNASTNSATWAREQSPIYGAASAILSLFRAKKRAKVLLFFELTKFFSIFFA